MGQWLYPRRLRRKRRGAATPMYLLEGLPANAVPGRSQHAYLDKRAGEGSFWGDKQSLTQALLGTRVIHHIKCFPSTRRRQGKVGSVLGAHPPNSRALGSRKEHLNLGSYIDEFPVLNSSRRLRTPWLLLLALQHGTRFPHGTDPFPLASLYPRTVSLTSVLTKELANDQEATPRWSPLASSSHLPCQCSRSGRQILRTPNRTTRPAYIPAIRSTMLETRITIYLQCLPFR